MPWLAGTGSCFYEGVSHAEIITVGDELLSGETADTNASWLDGRLAEWGWTVARHTTVPDEVEAIAAALTEAAARVALVVVSGGLGPTQDDVTLEGLARALGVGLRTDEPVAGASRHTASSPGAHRAPPRIASA